MLERFLKNADVAKRHRPSPTGQPQKRRPRPTTAATEEEKRFFRRPHTTPATVEKRRGPRPTGQPDSRELEKVEEMLERFLKNADVAKRHPAPTGQPQKRRPRPTSPATEEEKRFFRRPHTTPATVEKRRGPRPTGQPDNRELEKVEEMLERFLKNADVAKRHRPSPTGQPQKRRPRPTTPATEEEKRFFRRPHTTPASVEKRRGPRPTGQPDNRELEKVEEMLERFLKNADVAKRHPEPTGQPQKRRPRPTTPATEEEKRFGRRPHTTPATVEKRRGARPTGQPDDRELEKIEEMLERFLKNADVAKRHHPSPTGQPQKRRPRPTTPATEEEKRFFRRPHTTPATVEKRRGPRPTGQPDNRELEKVEEMLERFLKNADVAKRHRPSPTGQPQRRRPRPTTPATEEEKRFGRRPHTTPATVEKRRGPRPTGQPDDRELEKVEEMLERFLKNADVAKRHRPSPTGQPQKRRPRPTTPATEEEKRFFRRPHTTPATVEKRRGPRPTGQPINRELEKIEEILQHF